MKKNLYLLSLGILACSCSEPTDVVTGRARVIYTTYPAAQAINVQPAAEPVQAPAPAASVSLARDIEPATTTTTTTPKKPLASQNQPVTTAPDPMPIAEAPIVKPEPAPLPETTTPAPRKSLATQQQPATTTPAHAPVAEKPEIALSQEFEKQTVPGAQYVITTPKKQVTPQPEAPAPVTPPVAAAPKKAVATQVQPVTTAPVTPPAKEEPKKPVVTQPQAVSIAPAVLPVATSTAPATVVRPRAAVSQQQPRTTAPYQTGQKEKRRYPVMPGQNRGLRSRGM